MRDGSIPNTTWPSVVDCRPVRPIVQRKLQAQQPAGDTKSHEQMTTMKETTRDDNGFFITLVVIWNDELREIGGTVAVCNMQKRGRGGVGWGWMNGI